MVDGKRYETVREAAKAFDIPYRTVYTRIDLGWDILRALTEPIREQPTNTPVTVNGKRFDSIADAAKENDLEPGTVYARLRKGVPLEKAFAPKRKWVPKDK